MISLFFVKSNECDLWTIKQGLKEKETLWWINDLFNYGLTISSIID